jgi:hypothetical protein
VNRGGSRNNDAANCRSADRDNSPNGNNNNGFRVALVSSGKHKRENATRYIPVFQVAAILVGRCDDSSLNFRLFFALPHASALSGVHPGLFRLSTTAFPRTGTDICCGDFPWESGVAFRSNGDW